jgi:hypothetical protein
LRRRRSDRCYRPLGVELNAAEAALAWARTVPGRGDDDVRPARFVYDGSELLARI